MDAASIGMVQKRCKASSILTPQAASCRLPCALLQRDAPPPVSDWPPIPMPVHIMNMRPKNNRCLWWRAGVGMGQRGGAGVCGKDSLEKVARGLAIAAAAAAAVSPRACVQARAGAPP